MVHTAPRAAIARPLPHNPSPPHHPINTGAENMHGKKDKIVVYRRDEVDDELLENLVKAVKGKTRLYTVEKK